MNLMQLPDEKYKMKKSWKAVTRINLRVPTSFLSFLSFFHSFPFLSLYCFLVSYFLTNYFPDEIHDIKDKGLEINMKMKRKEACCGRKYQEWEKCWKEIILKESEEWRLRKTEDTLLSSHSCLCFLSTFLSLFFLVNIKNMK